MNATYRAKWTDEETKLEFVVEIKTPKDKVLETLNAQPEKAVQGQFAWQPR